MAAILETWDYFTSYSQALEFSNANPTIVSMALNGILISTTISEMLTDSFENEIFGNDSSTQSLTIETLILTFLFLISCINVWIMSLKFKAYTLLHQPTSGINEFDESYKIKSPNASLVLIDVQNDMDKKVQKASWLSNEKWEKEVRLGERWQIKVWDPSDLNLTLLSSFSPLHVLLAFKMGNDNFWITILFLSCNYYLMQLVNNMWSGKLRDQSIVSGQVLNEFTQGFVYKLSAFKEKKDAQS